MGGVFLLILWVLNFLKRIITSYFLFCDIIWIRKRIIWREKEKIKVIAHHLAIQPSVDKKIQDFFFTFNRLILLCIHLRIIKCCVNLIFLPNHVSLSIYYCSLLSKQILSRFYKVACFNLIFL